MTKVRITQFAVFSMAGLIAVTPGFAQVDHRVRSNSESGAGRALDANNQVGSGGFNQPAQSQYGFDYGQRANEIITGNVTGLAGFQGISPIVANNAFRVGLPSAGLAQFRATSVGLPDVRSGFLTGGPGSYYDTQQIIPDAGSYARSVNLPGSTFLSSPYRRPPMPYERELQQQFLIRDPSDTRLQANQSIAPRTRQTPIVPGTSGSSITDTSRVSPFANAAGSSIFGTPSLAQPLSLNANPQSIYPIDFHSPSAGRLNPPGNRPDQRLASDTPIGMRKSLTNESRPDDPFSPMGSGDLTERGPLAGPVLNQGPPGPDGIPLQSSIKTTALTGGDRFLDMVAAVQAAQSDGIKDLGFIARAKSNSPNSDEKSFTENGSTELSVTPPAKSDSPAPKTGSVSDMASAAKWVSSTLDDPIKTFTGRYQGKLNDNMVAAEDALHRGQYYSAARFYEIASNIDPSNPLPLLGRGHALTAAGDYMSAVVSIERGIARFPQIAAFRIDLPAIVGRHDVFDIRRADLESRLETLEDYRLRFLLGYLEIYSGMTERGLNDLNKASSQAPSGSMIALFPDFVTGKAPVPELRD